MRTMPIIFNAIGVAYHNQREIAMKTAGTKGYVYFLSVKEAEKIATEHEGEDWDLWSDMLAIRRGFFSYYAEMEMMAQAQSTRSAS